MPLRRRTQRTSPTVWIALALLVLVLGYVGVVILVTRQHIAHRSDVQQPVIRGLSTPTLKDKIEKVKVGKKEAKKEDYSVKNVRNEFGHGVQAQVLLPHHTDIDIVAAKVDPPDHPTPNNILTAYLEPLRYEDWEIQPLPVRTTAKASNLQKVTYSRLQSCRKLPQQWPIDDTPTDADPFLPWIHDVFPSNDGKFIQFVAQNKRRCKTGSKEKDIIMHMQPQIALMQHVPVKRLSNNRYRLSTHEEADPDGLATRFICRFKPSMQETLSVFNFDYDWTSLRKRYRVGFHQDEGDTKSIHTSQIIFRCPVPEELQEKVRSGETVQNDWASLFVDLIPIRTAPRYGPPNQWLQPKYKDFLDKNVTARFDPVAAWGDQHILPAIEDSGRLENIPICKPSLQTYADMDPKIAPFDPPKKHRLVSCLWASAGYATRGNRFAINDGQRRLLEWITYNKLIGFDHFYVYDNTGAFHNDSSLQPITDLFPGDVTYIPWPAAVCNNNPNNVDSVGERSSQYAAESSCRLRFGAHTDWIGQFDIDEYLIPMGDYKGVPALLDKLDEEDTRIISFGSWRAWPRWAFIDEIVPVHDEKVCWKKEPCFHLSVPAKNTMLQTYNCDRQKPGQKQHSMPAEKQLYRADYVLQHFIHYTAVTQLSEKNVTEVEEEGLKWPWRAFPDPRQRFGDELSEALMIHTKAVAVQDTVAWEKVCHINVTKLPKRQQGLCRLGVPWPKDHDMSKPNATEEGWAFNCYVNEKVEDYFIPKLDAALAPHAHIFDSV